MSSREEFEKEFKTPSFVEWSEQHQDYMAVGRISHGSTRDEMLTEYRAFWKGWQVATYRQQERIADLEAQRTAYLDGKCVCPHSTAGSASHYPGCPQGQQERIRELEGALRSVVGAYRFAHIDNNAIVNRAEQALSATARNDAHDWKLQGSAGVWESYYKCIKCCATVQENTDGPSKPDTGCATARGGGGVIDRTYRCNLCRDTIFHDPYSGFKGIGLYWSVNQWEEKPHTDAENHLCIKCLVMIQSLQKRCIHNVRGCSGGMKCTSDHK